MATASCMHPVSIDPCSETAAHKQRLVSSYCYDACTIPNCILSANKRFEAAARIRQSSLARANILDDICSSFVGCSKLTQQ